MSFLHHPAFQSLVLPFVLAVAISLLLRPLGLRWSSLGAALGLLLAMAMWPGFDWPAASRVQTLPWLAIGSTLLAALAIALKAPGTRAMGRRNGLVATVLLTLIAFGLGAWGALGGSLLLAQLALMLATVGGVAVLWAWRAASVSPVSLLPLLLTGAGIALCLAWLPAAGPGAAEGADVDDPYYAPRWK
ncbi:hypothetical protein [Hydrogenophaga sp.]|uniref:hypothetical protein n=1 Tax=Hydrogenophaga sp. TaxID=1904254 RepID=UPI00273014A3|nr:hypothetical protein [Hydrogenophaga sp.]MDP2073327.1 hypothetical protein [Hydrogenophaga sp.]MDP3106728.1 hypothetical protein [Hydrogenophaga sp.]MDZ4280019.1 hypothetical protein [Hydrogenophaga sp.]MDZ4397379.1 hypothetical protein [Hydrogenophaga sp.]